MKSYDTLGSGIWGGLLLGTMFWMFWMGLQDYKELTEMKRLEAVCEQAGGVPARIRPDVLCFAPEAFNGEPK